MEPEKWSAVDVLRSAAGVTLIASAIQQLLCCLRRVKKAEYCPTSWRRLFVAAATDHPTFCPFSS